VLQVRNTSVLQQHPGRQAARGELIYLQRIQRKRTMGAPLALKAPN
jgi:hypothetical protein